MLFSCHFEKIWLSCYDKNAMILFYNGFQHEKKIVFYFTGISKRFAFENLSNKKAQNNLHFLHIFQGKNLPKNQPLWQ